MKPYIEKILNENLSIRQFDNAIDEQELVWHRDREDRIIIPLKENDWKIQLDNQLPINLNPNNPIFIESGQYHRVIKGSEDLIVKVFKINLDDSENLNETIKKTLNLFLENVNENLNEEYPQSFDMEYFKTLTSFAQRINYCTEHLQKLASGSSRVVFKIDDEKVLKLAKNKKGLAQNEVEIDYSHYDGLEGILAKVFDYEENNLWLEMELAVRAKKSDFKKIVGFSFDDYSSALFNHEIDAGNSRIRYGKMDLDKDVLDEMWENEFMQDMFDLIGTYGIPSGDLRRVSSYGIVKRNGEDTIVLVDYGLTSDVYQDYYSTN